jgi:hypothetical protein
MEMEKKLSYFCTITPEISSFSRTLGMWDAEIDIDAESISHFRQLFLRIREEFSGIIQSFNSYDIYKEHMRRYMIRL